MDCMFKAIHYYYLMHSRTSEIYVLINTSLIFQNLFQLLDKHDRELQKGTKVKLDLLIDTDMLLIVENGIRGGTCQSIYRYAKGNSKYSRYYDKNEESSYLQYWDVNNLYEWAMSQKLPVNNFERTEDTSQFNEDFIKNYNEEGDKRYFL